MFALQSRKDGFRVTLPDDFIVPEVKEKYGKILMEAHSFVYKPIDFLNETIQKVQVFGFTNATFEQQQQTYGEPIRSLARVRENAMRMGGASFQYRSAVSPIALTDRTLNIEFRHTLGYVNYMMLVENFIYLYSRDTASDDMFDHINVDLFNHKGEVYARIVLKDPVINGMDMLDFDYSQPIAQSGTFKVEFKYSNFDYQLLSYKDLSSTVQVAEVQGSN